MYETQRSSVPSEQYVFEYRAKNLWLGRDIPEFVPITLRVQEAKAPQEITFLVDQEDAEALEAKGGPDCFLPAALRQEQWATRAEQEVGTPDFKAWIEDLALQCTPYLLRLFAELFTYYLLIHYEYHVKLALQNEGLAALENNLPYLVYSKDMNGTLIIGINPEDEVIIPLVDDMETRLKQVYSHDDLWEPLGRWLWVSFAVWTAARMKDALGEEALATMSEDQWETTFVAYAYDDEELYHNTMLYLMQGYIHQRVLNVMSLFLEEWREWLDACSDWRVLQDLASDDDARLTAAGRVLDRLGHSVVWQRWPLVQPALAERATQHGHSPEDELRQLAMAGLFMVIGTIEPPEFDEVSVAYRTLRSRLNKQLTIDLLGPEWRKKHLIQDHYPQEDLRARLLVQQLLVRTPLSQRERQVIDAFLQGEEPPETAHRLGIHPGTVRVHFHNASKKIARIT